MIDDSVLIEAADGHIDRLSGPPTATIDPIEAALAGMGVEPLAARACLAALSDARDLSPSTCPSLDAAYKGGLIDGLVIGIRAARIEFDRA